MADISPKLRLKLQADDHEERCGLVLRSGRIIETINRHPQPALGFVIPGKDLLKYQKTVVGTWHTHPRGQTSHLSQEDWLGFSQWPHLTHHVIGADGVRSYVVEDGMVMEQSFAAG